MKYNQDILEVFLSHNGEKMDRKIDYQRRVENSRKASAKRAIAFEAKLQRIVEKERKAQTKPWKSHSGEVDSADTVPNLVNRFSDVDDGDDMSTISPSLVNALDMDYDEMEDNVSTVEKKISSMASNLSDDFLDVFGKFWLMAREDLSGILQTPVYDAFENVALLLIALKDVRTVSGFVSVITLYVKHYLDSSALSYVASALTGIIGAPVMVSQSGTLEVDPVVTDYKFDGIRKILSHFRSFRESDLATRVLSLVSMIVTLGFVKSSDLTFSWGGFEIFRAESLRKQVTAADFLEAILETVKLFIERGVRCFSGEGVAAFFSDKSLISYDDEYTFIMSKVVLFEIGNLSDIGIDEHEYDRRLAAITDLTMEYLNNCKQGERAYYSSRLEKLKGVRVKLILAQRKTVRRKPYGVLLYGGSSVGKSAMANSLIRYILAVNNFDHDPTSIVTLNEFDKFQSEYRSKHAGVIFDDLANGKVETTEGNPLMKVIQFLNNIPMAALNPNVELKGNVMISPEVVLGTTNVQHLNAEAYSMEPLSIRRRFETTITVTVKPEFRKAGTEMLDPIKAQSERGKAIPDFNFFTVEEAVLNGNDVIMRVREYKGVPLKNITVHKLLEFLRDDSEAHFAAQNAYVQSQLDLANMSLCPHRLLSTCCTECANDKIDSQFGFADVVDPIRGALSDIENSYVSRVSGFARGMLDTSIGKLGTYVFFKRSFKEDMERIARFHAFTFLLACVLSVLEPRLSFLIALIPLSWIVFSSLSVEHRRRQIIANLASIRHPSLVLRTAMDRVSANKLYAIAGAMSVLVAGYHLFRKWTAEHSHMSAPLDRNTFTRSDKKDQSEFWTPREIPAPIYTSPQAKTTTFEQLEQIICSKLAHVRVLWPDGKWRVNDALPIASNVWIFPNHAVPNVQCEALIIRPRGEQIKCVISQISTEKLPNTDLCVWYLPEAGPQKDLIHYLPAEPATRTFNGRLVYNDGEQVAVSEFMECSLGRVTTTKGGTFDAWRYMTSSNTYEGMCVATLIGKAPTPVIAGFHLAGKDFKGAAGFTTQKDVRDAIKRLDSRPHILTSHSAVPMPEEIIGVKIGPFKEPNARSAVNKVENPGHMNVFGAHTLGTASYVSSVVTSDISKDVEEVMDLPKIHGRPYKMNDPMHWEVDLLGKTDVAYQFKDEFIQKATIDYSVTLMDFFKQHPEKLGNVGKLDNDAVLAGIDGVDGFNAMNFGSSKGFPETGPKNDVVEKSERFVEGIDCPRDCDPKYWDEVARMEQEFLQSVRINTVFKGSLKDEPTKLTKKKVRVFAGCNMAFTMLVRKYYLSMAKLVMDNSNIFECAVGINVESPEWHQLVTYVHKYGVDRVIAGDYKAFDGRMAPKFMLASFKILIDIARVSGNYDEEDLLIMRGIASEICSPTYDFHGVLLQVFGSNPSGHPLTVIINSMVNSLYLRYCYYYLGSKQRSLLRPLKLPLFNRVVRAVTYGDDNLMSVREGFSWFNHTALADTFAECGITYTMADKEAESVPYINGMEASFLKHFPVWDEELGLYRAKIEENSIQKMLHTHLSSKHLTRAEQSSNGIIDAMDKYFGFGRDTYNKRRAQLIEVASRHEEITNMEAKLLTYDEQINRFCERGNWTA